MFRDVDNPPPDSEADFCGEEYDNLYFLIMDLQQDGMTFPEILDLLQERWQPQITKLKEHGYLGG